MARKLRYGASLSALACLALSASPASAQIWSDVDRSEQLTAQAAATVNAPEENNIPVLIRARQMKLDINALSATLDRAPLNTLDLSGTTLDLPLPTGGYATFAISNSPIMGRDFAGHNLGIQTFRAVDVDNPRNTGRFDITPKGFHAMFDHGTETVFIDPVAGGEGYQSYFKADYVSEMSNYAPPEFTCGTESHAAKSDDGNLTPLPSRSQRQSARAFDFGTELRTYRFAVAATGEYTAFHGGTKADGLAAIVTAVNRVNQVFERDAAFTLELVPNNIDVVYTDAATDPYTDDDPSLLIDETKPDLDANIGLANYDIGHVFSTRGGGLAGLGVVCSDTRKSEGVTGIQRPINDAFYIDFVAHEIGHQFGANHIFNGTENGCAGNRVPSAAYEVGSGSTIMSYAQLCGSEDLQIGSDDFFHTYSITQMRDHIDDATRGGSCGVVTSLNNAAPVVEAGANGAVPISTPFSLTGTATDADGDTLSYIWEQYDLGRPTTSRASQTGAVTGPLFRSLVPVATGTRSFPQISDILSNTTTYGEILPTITRTLNFRLTVRDGKGGVTAAARSLEVTADAGPFTTENPADTTWAAGDTQTLVWDVANTTAAPINCATVNIDLSTDAGMTFPTALAQDVANSGSAQITVPTAETTTARVRISCSTQPFFAINPTVFSISGTAPPATANTVPVATADAFTTEQDSSDVVLAVLGNDSDADGDTLSITSVSGFNAGGSARISGTNILYTTPPAFTGTERFDYAISDGQGGTASATVTMTVTPPPNDDPVAVDDAFTINQDSAAANFNVTANDSDADGDPLTLASVGTPSNGGTVSITSGFMRYAPATGFSGTETVSYTVDDGRGGQDSATATFTIRATVVTPPVVTPTIPTTGGGGGGSMGLLLLALLGLRRRFGQDDLGETA